MLDEEENHIKKSAAPAASGKSYSHLNDTQWKQFCDGRLHHYEVKWTKKLEDYTDDDNREIVSDKEEEEEDVEDDDSDEDDDVVGGHMKQYIKADGGAAKNLSKSQTFDSKSKKIIEVTEGDRKSSKDDWTVTGTPEYANNTYWKVPDQYSIDDLLRESEGL